MNQRTNVRIYHLIIIGVFLVFASSCKKDDDTPAPPPTDPIDSKATNGKTTAVFNTDVTYGTMTDQDGNVYKTVTIGTQTWMAENLRTTKYNNGAAISWVTDNTAWASLSKGAYCNFNNTNNADTIATYGRLYNKYAVGSGKLAPKGWHVATHFEWETLTSYLGGESVAGDKLKETGYKHWNISNSGATNETGFTALPGGCRYYDDGTFSTIGVSGFWWAETANTYPYYRLMFYDESKVYSLDNDDTRGVDLYGLSVRCVKD